jgi:hypothetical protein
MTEPSFAVLVVPLLVVPLFLGGQSMINRSDRERLFDPTKCVQSFTVGTAMYALGGGVIAACMLLFGTSTLWFKVVAVLAQLLLIGVVVYANVWIHRQVSPEATPGNVIAP